MNNRWVIFPNVRLYCALCRCCTVLFFFILLSFFLFTFFIRITRLCVAIERRKKREGPSFSQRVDLINGLLFRARWQPNGRGTGVKRYFPSLAGKVEMLVTIGNQTAHVKCPSPNHSPLKRIKSEVISCNARAHEVGGIRRRGEVRVR